MRIALDAMGSDNCPIPDVAGGILAARQFGDTILFVGDQQRIQVEINKENTKGLHIEIIHAPEAVTMHDRPSAVGKSKPQSSMHIGMDLVKDGFADAFVTVGNTGAAHAIAMLYTLRRLPLVKRPALSGIFRFNNKPIIFLDIGANADSRPEWLVQFAVMGQIYAQNALGIRNACVGLLSNGEEEGKGNQLIRDTSSLLHRLPLNFAGNVEPKEILKGHVDVVVSDGFTGNILTKTFEASTRYLGGLIREEVKSSLLALLGGALIRPALNRVRKKIDTEEVGGAPLLGVNGVVIIGHGSSSAMAVKNAIHQARLAVSGNVISAIQDGLESVSDLLKGIEG